MLLLHEAVGVMQHLKPLRPRLSAGLVAVCLLALAGQLSAQDLDPRAYARAPINATFLVTGFAVSHGAVLTDPTLTLTSVDASGKTTAVTTWKKR